MSAATRAAWAEKVLAMIGCSERGHAPTANGKFCARCGFRLPKDGTPPAAPSTGSPTAEARPVPKGPWSP